MRQTQAKEERVEEEDLKPLVQGALGVPVSIVGGVLGHDKTRGV